MAAPFAFIDPGRRTPAAEVVLMMIHRPFFLGIAGGSCSGKSTLAGMLAGGLPGRDVVIVPLDAYYRDLGVMRLEAREEMNFDLPSAIEEELAAMHLGDLASSGRTRIPLYRFDTHSRAPEKEWPTLSVDLSGELRPVVIVEGLHVLYLPSVREVLDRSVFVEADLSVCLERRITRDVRERGRDPEKVRERFRSMTAPMFVKYVAPTASAADLVVDGTAPFEKAVEKIISLIPAP